MKYRSKKDEGNVTEAAFSLREVECRKRLPKEQVASLHGDLRSQVSKPSVWSEVDMLYPASRFLTGLFLLQSLITSEAVYTFSWGSRTLSSGISLSKSPELT